MAGMGFPCSGFQNYNFCISRLKFTFTLIKDTKLMERESSKECSQCSYQAAAYTCMYAGFPQENLKSRHIKSQESAVPFGCRGMLWVKQTLEWLQNFKLSPNGETNTIPANFFWVKCGRFSRCHDQTFWKRPDDFWRFPTTFLRLPNITENVCRFSEDNNNKLINDIDFIFTWILE